METTATSVRAMPASGPASYAGPIRLGGVAIPTRFFLAPLAGYTTLAFRQAVRDLGGLGLATTDLVNPRALVRASRKSLELIQTCLADRPLAVQIYGSIASELCEAARWLEAYGASVVDINMGCPVHKVCRNGGGSALMCDPVATVALVRAVVESVRIPVTVKMRLGWDENSWSAPLFAREFEEAGVAAVTVHGRTREQGFTGRVNLDGIRAVVEAVQRIPVIGNGDVRTPADAMHMLRYTGCAGVAIGRGALLNPWIFDQIQASLAAGDVPPRPTREHRLDFMTKHFHALVQHRGEWHGCLTFRKVANWYCRVLRPGREIQSRLVRLESLAEFDLLIARMREQRLPREIEEAAEEAAISVPKGPVEFW
jgi:nifR3 family TIM-barrel protein